ncbi:PAQR family membrane homeostasis protein TrhA [Mycolicibacterium baixiangningiae]|uniref:PAQR family membrane homeostasis protein TrhA n=1 Tax=Mycolicibacterium baixiangningiae TaxID=2761578 RepID=UPI00384BA9EE
MITDPPGREVAIDIQADPAEELICRPRARGLIHLVSAAAAVVAGAALVPVAWMGTGSSRAGWAALIYVIAIIAMFSVSAAYHRVRWSSPSAEKWMMRADHSLIFVFIAATYTPFAVLALPPGIGTQALVIMWTGAAAGVTLKMLWPSAPRWVGVPLYLMLGYVAVLFAEALLIGAGFTVVALLVAGAILYNIGAIFYGMRWPNPWPGTFAHHEFFHAFTAAGALCHFAAVWLVIQ